MTRARFRGVASAIILAARAKGSGQGSLRLPNQVFLFLICHLWWPRAAALRALLRANTRPKMSDATRGL